MSNLTVELYGNTLGTLTQKGKWFDFEVNYKIFEKYSLSSTIMSLAVPLNPQFTNIQKNRKNAQINY